MNVARASAPAARLPVDHVVALQRARGDGDPRASHARPADSFRSTITAGPGPASDVFAAGDATAFRIKQGGIASQQADTAAEAILADLGFPIAPRPFEPVLRGVLLSAGAAAYLQAPLAQGDAPPSAPPTWSLWWPPSKIAGRYLSPYLHARSGAPRTPELRPGSVPMSVDVRDVVHAVRGALDGDSVPPG